MKQNGEASTFTTHNVTEAWCVQHVRLNHSFDDFLIFVLDNQPSEGLLAESDRLEIVDFD